MALKAAGK